MESIYSKFYGNTQQQPFKIGAWNTAPRLRHSSSMPSIYNSSTAKPLPQLVNRTYNQPHINNNNHNVDAMKLQMLEYKLNNLENKSNELNRMNQQLTQMNYQPVQNTGYYPPAPLTGQMPGTSNYLMRQPTPIPTILRPPPQQMQMPMPPPQMQMPIPHQQMQVPPHQQMLVPPHQMLVPPPYYYYPPPVYDNIPYDNYDRRVSSHGRNNNRYTKPKKQKQRKYKLKSNNSNKTNSIETDRPEIQNPNENNNNNNEYNDISELEHSYDDGDEEEEETYRKPKQKQKQNNPNKKLISKSLKILNPKQGKYFMNDIRNNLALKLQQDQFENSNNINIIQQSCNEIRSILSDKLDKIETKQRLDFENLKNALYHGGSNKLKASMLNEFNGRHYDVNNYPDFTIPEEIKNIPQLIDKKIHDFEYKKEYEKNRQERLEKEIREKVANEIKIQKYLSSIKNNSISYLPPISYEGPSNIYGYNDEELLQAKIDIKVEEALKERDLERIKRLENEINKKELEIKTDYLKNLKLQQEIDMKNKMNSYIKDVPFVYEYNNSSKIKDDNNNEGNKKKKEKIKYNEDNNNKERFDNKDIEVKNEEHGKENKTKKKKRKKKNKDNDSVHKNKDNDNMIEDIKEPSIKTNNDDANKDIKEPIRKSNDDVNKDIKEPINNDDVNNDIPEPNVNNDSENENINNDVPEPEGIKIKTPEAEDNNNNNSEGANQYVATFE